MMSSFYIPLAIQNKDVSLEAHMKFILLHFIRNSLLCSSDWPRIHPLCAEIIGTSCDLYLHICKCSYRQKQLYFGVKSSLLIKVIFSLLQTMFVLYQIYSITVNTEIRKKNVSCNLVITDSVIFYILFDFFSPLGCYVFGLILTFKMSFKISIIF